MFLLVFTGRLGGDPELRYLPSGTPVANFSVACNRVYTNSNGERVEETTWFRVSAFGKLAEICNQYLSKGRQVLIEGRLRPDPQTGGPRIWMDNEGKPRASYEVIANSVEFLGGKGDGGAQTGEGANESYDLPAPGEDIPF